MLAARGEAVQRCAADHHRVRAQGQSLCHITATAKAAVDEDRQAAADCCGDFPEHLDGCNAVIELPAAVDRGARQGDIALGMQHAVQARRRYGKRGGAATSEHGGLERPSQCVDEDLRHEAQDRERCAVAPRGRLILRSAFDVLEGESRHAPPRDLAQVVNVQCASCVASMRAVSRAWRLIRAARRRAGR